MGISIWQLLIVILVVAVLFGGKRLRSLGSDLGESLKGFKKAIAEDETPEKLTDQRENQTTNAKIAEKSEESK